MRTDTTNPYRDATLDTLFEACSRNAGELADRRARSKEEREALADDIRLLLLEAAKRFTTGLYTPHNPEDALLKDESASLSAEFVKWYDVHSQRRLGEQRLVTLQRAADFVLGNKAAEWLEPGGRWHPDAPSVKGIESDDAMKGYLVELEALYDRRRKKDQLTSRT